MTVSQVHPLRNSEKQRNEFLLRVNGNAVDSGGKWPGFIAEWEDEWHIERGKEDSEEGDADKEGEGESAG